ncbi:MAG: hypothetical protein WKF92_16350 [Pyrinomonadaceae bacterium]
MNTTLITFALLLLLSAIGPAAMQAQNPCGDIRKAIALYDTFQEKVNGTDDSSKRAALNAANTYVTNYQSCEDFKDQIAYLNAYIKANSPRPATTKAKDSGPEWRTVEKPFTPSDRATAFHLQNWKFLNFFDIDENGELTGADEILVFIITTQPSETAYEIRQEESTRGIFQIRCSAEQYGLYQYIKSYGRVIDEKPRRVIYGRLLFHQKQSSRKSFQVRV